MGDKQRTCLLIKVPSTLFHEFCWSNRRPHQHSYIAEPEDRYCRCCGCNAVCHDKDAVELPAPLSQLRMTKTVLGAKQALTFILVIIEIWQTVVQAM